MLFRNDTEMQWPGLPPMARPFAPGVQPTNTQPIAGTQATLGAPVGIMPATPSRMPGGMTPRGQRGGTAFAGLPPMRPRGSYGQR